MNPAETALIDQPDVMEMDAQAKPKGADQIPPDPNSKRSKQKALQGLYAQVAVMKHEAFELGKQSQWNEAIAKWNEIIAFASTHGLTNDSNLRKLASAKRIAAMPMPHISKSEAADMIEKHLCASNPDFGTKSVRQTLQSLYRRKGENDFTVDRMLYSAAMGCAKWHNTIAVRKEDKAELDQLAKQQSVSMVLVWLRRDDSQDERIDAFPKKAKLVLASGNGV